MGFEFCWIITSCILANPILTIYNNFYPIKYEKIIGFNPKFFESD